MDDKELVSFDMARDILRRMTGGTDGVIGKFIDQQEEHHKRTRKLLDEIHANWEAGPEASRSGYMYAAAQVSEFHPEQ